MGAGVLASLLACGAGAPRAQAAEPAIRVMTGANGDLKILAADPAAQGTTGAPDSAAAVVTTSMGLVRLGRPPLPDPAHVTGSPSASGTTRPANMRVQSSAVGSMLVVEPPVSVAEHPLTPAAAASSGAIRTEVAAGGLRQQVTAPVGVMQTDVPAGAVIVDIDPSQAGVVALMPAPKTLYRIRPVARPGT